MVKNRRFFVGLVGVAAVVSYLIWTGVSETMVYYMTPVELMIRSTSDPTLHQVGVKVSGRIVKGSWELVSGEEQVHSFAVEDLENPEISFPVEYQGLLPDTFNDQENVEAVVEGRFREDGVFEATTVLTKCGSRYEASLEELAG
jgi:cytochrome c-type biogenesis protein CcmE